MARILRKILPSFIGVTLFILTFILVEKGCYYINQTDPTKFFRHTPHDFQEITTTSIREIAETDRGRKGDLARKLISLGIEKYTSLPRFTENSLQLDPGDYRIVGEKSQNYIMMDSDTVRPGIDDTFTKYALHTRRIKYRHHVKTDENFRRITGTPFHPEQKNLVLAGCSFTFGDGLNDDETFASRIGKLLPVNTFNLGVPGGHPGMTLSNLRKEGATLLKGLAETQTIMIYTFLNDHVSRTNGTSRYFAQNPYYYLPGTQYELEGETLVSYPRAEARFFDFIWFRRWLSELEFTRTFALEYPPIGEDQLKIMAKVLSEIRNQSISLLGHDVKLFVALYPGEKHFGKKLIPFLEAEGISYFDYSDINPGLFKGQDRLPGDLHPSTEMNRFYAELLAFDLEKEIR